MGRLVEVVTVVPVGFVALSLRRIAAFFLGSSLLLSAHAYAQQAVPKPVVKPVAAAPIALDQTAAARLLAMVLDAYMPKVLHQEKDQPWMGGKRSIKISKVGAPTLNSNRQSITVTFPLKTELSGNINTNLVLMQVKANCVASFTAPAAVNLWVDFTKKPLVVKAVVNMVVPPVMANCDGYQLAVEAVIQNVIEQQKIKWQNDIQQQITDGLRVLGL